MDRFHQGEIDHCESACEHHLVFPDQGQWSRFIDKLLAVLGGAFLVGGVLFFFAFNWESLGRFDKFALIQLVIVSNLGALWWNKDRNAASQPFAQRALLFSLSFFIGVLFALIGQIYQTGADAYQLFLTWCLAIVPLVLVSRCQFHWMLWAILANLAAQLYFEIYMMHWSFMRLITTELWFIVIFNGLIIALLTQARQETDIIKIEVLPKDSNLLIHALHLGVGIAITVLGIEALFKNSHWYWLQWFAWAGWAALLFYCYRLRSINRFVLAGLCMSLITMGCALLVKIFEDVFGLETSLLIALFVIVSSTFAAQWLRKLSQKEVQS